MKFPEKLLGFSKKQIFQTKTRAEASLVIPQESLKELVEELPKENSEEISPVVAFGGARGVHIIILSGVFPENFPYISSKSFAEIVPEISSEIV